MGIGGGCRGVGFPETVGGGFTLRLCLTDVSCRLARRLMCWCWRWLG